MSTTTYDQWVIHLTKFPSITDAKIEDFAPSTIAKTAPHERTLQSALEREIFLVAQIKQVRTAPAIFNSSYDEVVRELIAVRKFLATKQ